MQSDLTFFVSVCLSALAIASLWTWMAIAVRWREGAALVPRVARQTVPWGGIEVVVIIALYLTLQIGLVSAVDRFNDGQDASTNEAATELEGDATSALDFDPDEENVHPVIFLLVNGASVWSMVACVLAAVIVAPVVEEFLFRLVFQGWLERLEASVYETGAVGTTGTDTGQNESDTGGERADELGAVAAGDAGKPYVAPTISDATVQDFGEKPVPRGWVPIIVSSLVFALIHFRSGETEAIQANELMAASFASLLTLACGVSLLRRAALASWTDLGVAVRHVLADVGLGVLAFFAVAPVILMVQVASRVVLPGQVAADPIALFPFAIALGYLYQRTHRLLPSIVAHFCLNAFGIGMVWLQYG